MGNRIFSKQRIELFKGIQCTLLCKDVKRISLKVKPSGEVIISYPVQEPAENAITFARKNEKWVRNTIEKMKQKAPTAEPPFTVSERREFIVRLKEVFEKYERQMGLRASVVTVRLMTSRWGSCHPVTRRISINLRLARKPIECTEYVVVHELAHIVHPNHSERFWLLVGKHFPDYQNTKRLLRRL